MMRENLQRLVISPSQRQEEQIILNAAQKHYLKRVLRLDEGDCFVAMDGQGKAWLTQLSENSAAIVEAFSLSDSELPVAVSLIVALPKGNGFDEIVRCTTELGVSNLVPIISNRTLLKPSPQKLLRWRRIAAEAAEQSERELVPQVCEPTTFADFVASYGSNSATSAYICVARGDVPHLLTCLQLQPELTSSHNGVPANIAIATGTEGGWTAQEIEQICDLGFQPVSLGKRILRAITAPIVALSVVAAMVENSSLKNPTS